MRSANATDKDHIDRIRKGFHVYFKSACPGMPLLATTFCSIFRNGTNHALITTTVQEEDGVLFDKTKLNLASNQVARQQICDAFVQWLDTPESKQLPFSITEVHGMDSEKQQPPQKKVAAVLLPLPSGGGGVAVDDEIARLKSASDAVVVKLNEAAQQAIETAVAQVKEAVASTARDACNTLKKKGHQADMEEEVQRASLKAGFDAEKAETTKRVEQLEAQLSSLRMERAVVVPVPPPPPHDDSMDRMRQIIASLEKRVQDLTVRSREPAPSAADPIQGSSSERAAEPPRRQMKRGREEEEEDDDDNNNIPTRRMARRTVVVTAATTAATSSIASLPYQAIRHCVTALFGEDTLRNLEVGARHSATAAAAAAKKK